jgi:hypothetical protein
VFGASVFRIRVVGVRIEKTLFGKWVLASRPIEQLKAVRLGLRLFPVALLFEDGFKIRLVGFPIPEMFRFAQWLKENAPHCLIEE